MKLKSPLLEAAAPPPADKAEVEGLPESALALAAQQAQKEGHEGATPEDGPWLFTLDMPSYMPVMTHAKNRCSLVWGGRGRVCVGGGCEGGQCGPPTRATAALPCCSKPFGVRHARRALREEVYRASITRAVRKGRGSQLRHAQPVPGCALCDPHPPTPRTPCLHAAVVGRD